MIMSRVSARVFSVGIWAAAAVPVFVQAITLTEIEARLSGIAASYSEDDATKERLQRAYSNARDLLQSAQRYDEEAKQYEKEANAGPKKLKELQRDLAGVERRRERPAVSDREKSLPIVELERLDREAESRRTGSVDKLSEIENRERALVVRPAQLRANREPSKARIAELELALGAPPELAGTDTAAADTALLEAELVLRRAALRKLDQELLSHSIRLELVRAERDVAAAELEVRTMRTTELGRLLLHQRRDAAESVIAETQRAQDVAGASHPLIRQATDRNAALGRELSTVIERHSKVAEERARIAARHASLQKEFERAQERLRYAGYGAGLGHLLIDQRRRLPDLRLLTRASKVRKATVARFGLRSIEIDDRINELEDDPMAGERLLLDYAAEHGKIEKASKIGSELSGALRDQENVLRVLAENYSNYLRAVGDVEFEAQQLTAVARSYGDYLERKIIWIPNVPPVGVGTLLDATRAADWLVAGENWRTTLADVYDGLRRAPLRLGLLALALFLAVWLRRLLERSLLEIGAKLRTIGTDRFRFTLIAMAASVVLAAPWAIFLWLGAEILRAATDPSDFSLALAHALRALAPIVFAFQWFGRLLRQNGVGRQHFRWLDGVAAGVRRSTARLVVVFIPAYLLAVLFEHQDNASFQSGMGRLAFVVATIALALYAYRLMKPDGVLVKHLLVGYPGALLTRFHLLIGTVAVVLPASFAVLAAIGYYYTALNLSRYLLQTGGLIVVAVVIRALAMRSLTLAESRLAIRRARERRDAMREAGEGEVEGTEISDDDLPIDIATINTQTRMILNNIIGWSFAVALYLIWQGALPALGILESVHLWDIAVPGASGQDIQSITLATVFVAAIIVAVTSIAAKNLPGVLEIGLLQRLPLQPGSRYAITTLSQYSITAIGVTVALGALGARWSQIQWLVAALSVGLGFGLQEIVANFISGLILLFERPIRVGDTVTIGELTGKVARIRIRATTIVDWDNKEIVVPNKNFITDRFVNWTLSDPVVRIIIKVGIAYGSDVTKALEVMHEAANGPEKVLQDPAPRALFLGFGDSSLDFEIQVYIRDLAERLPVSHDIHTAINAGFAEAGIEIPFPQRDVHVRSISSPGRDEMPER